MKEKPHHFYEGMYILSVTLPEEGRQKAIEKIVNKITENGGTVLQNQDLGRKKLAYPIGNHKEGHYILLHFQAPPEKIAGMWVEYNRSEDVLRYLTLEIEEKQALQEQGIRHG